MKRRGVSRAFLKRLRLIGLCSLGLLLGPRQGLFRLSSQGFRALGRAEALYHEQSAYKDYGLGHLVKKEVGRYGRAEGADRLRTETVTDLRYLATIC